MAKQPTDIVLTQPEADSILAHWLGGSPDCTRIERLSGGMLNSALRLHFDVPPFTAVIKLNSEPDHDGFAEEKKRLQYLHEHSQLRCPKVYLQDGSRRIVPYGLILLESLPGANLMSVHLAPSDRITIDREIAGALLELHSHTRDTFGPVDRDPGTAQWSDIMVPRLHDMRQEMDAKLPPTVLSDIDRALDAAEDPLRHQGQPTLVHGDIWAGNVMIVEGHDGWHLSGFLDPGVQYADVEYELAYLQVFRTVTPAFFEAYTAHTPLRPGFELRRLFYWLNTYMIHVWLFGDQHYRQSVASVAAEIVRQI